MITISLPAVTLWPPPAVEIPKARESVRVIGPDSRMSNAFPAGGPSRMSVRTTSASSISTIRCAVVDPTNPPPTTVTFFLLILLLVSTVDSLPRAFCDLSASALNFSFHLARDSDALHVLDNRARKRRRADLRRSGHLPLEIIRHALLLNGPRYPVLDQLSRFFPSQKLKHHGPRQHQRAWIDHILVRVFRSRPMRSLKYAVAISDVRSRRHPQPANLGRARI